MGALAPMTPVTVPSLPSGEVCQFFAKNGWCKWESACKHAHIPGPSTPLQTVSVSPPVPQEVCQFFLKAGWCKWADACKHAHVAGPTTPAVLSSLCGAGTQPGVAEVCQFF